MHFLVLFSLVVLTLLDMHYAGILPGLVTKRVTINSVYFRYKPSFMFHWIMYVSCTHAACVPICSILWYVYESDPSACSYPLICVWIWSICLLLTHSSPSLLCSPLPLLSLSLYPTCPKQMGPPFELRFCSKFLPVKGPFFLAPVTLVLALGCSGSLKHLKQFKLLLAVYK